MKDINGIEIKVGMTVKTQQYSGGVMPPAPAETGVVIYKEYAGTNHLMIKFRKNRHSFDSYRILHGQVNEVLNTKQPL